MSKFQNNAHDFGQHMLASTDGGNQNRKEKNRKKKQKTWKKKIKTKES